MSDSINKINPYYTPALTGDNLIQAAQTNNDGLFKKALTTMLLASSMSGMGSDSSGDGFSINPMMMMLLEQLISNQVEPAAETADPSADTAAAQTSGQIEPFAPVKDTQFSADVPHGRPVGGRVTQGSHPGHVAIDFGIPLGTPVQSTMAGKVIHAGWNNEGYGNLVIVENGPYRTYYAHLSSIPVKIGDVVSSGTTIGLSGSTGNSTGPHVHYEIRRNQIQIDPTPDTLQA